MNGAAQRAHRTVTERLTGRLEIIEPLVDRMMHNGDALYVGHEANATRIAALDDRVRSYGGKLGELQVLVEHLRRQLSDQQAMTRWQRLKWVFGG